MQVAHVLSKSKTKLKIKVLSEAFSVLVNINALMEKKQSVTKINMRKNLFFERKKRRLMIPTCSRSRFEEGDCCNISFISLFFFVIVFLNIYFVLNCGHSFCSRHDTRIPYLKERSPILETIAGLKLAIEKSERADT